MERTGEGIRLQQKGSERITGEQGLQDDVYETGVPGVDKASQAAFREGATAARRGRRG